MQRKWFILVVVLAVIAIWMGRFELVAEGTNGVYRLDRLTGNVDQCSSFWRGCVGLDKRI